MGEPAEVTANWTAVDLNEIDSDGDGLPDGWVRYGSCQWIPSNAGINPMNSSDAFNNPDGDGYDVNRDGIIGPDEALNNWMEYHIIDRIMLANESTDGRLHPDGFETALFNPSWASGPTTSFGQQSSDDVRSLAPVADDRGSLDPLLADTDNDGMPDGWEVWFSRWDSFSEEWTLNPANEGDPAGDPDGDGMTNWEEYASIKNDNNEVSTIVSSPQFYLLVTPAITTPQAWSSAGETSLSDHSCPLNSIQPYWANYGSKQSRYRWRWASRWYRTNVHCLE